MTEIIACAVAIIGAVFSVYYAVKCVGLSMDIRRHWGDDDDE